MEFPYLKKKTELGSIFTPYCWIEIKTKRGLWRKHKFIFDTGADYTSVPRYISEVVGIDISKTKQEAMYTANNEPMITYFGRLSIRFDLQELVLPCVFTDRDDTPFLLGRAGLIERFEMLLSAQDKQLVISENNPRL